MAHEEDAELLLKYDLVLSPTFWLRDVRHDTNYNLLMASVIRFETVHAGEHVELGIILVYGSGMFKITLRDVARTDEAALRRAITRAVMEH